MTERVEKETNLYQFLLQSTQVCQLFSNKTSSPQPLLCSVVNVALLFQGTVSSAGRLVGLCDFDCGGLALCEFDFDVWSGDLTFGDCCRTVIASVIRRVFEKVLLLLFT